MNTREITPKIKRQVFALYYNQPIMRSKWWTEDVLIMEEHRGYPVDPRLGDKDFYLEVIPLSEITDEDAIEVARIFNIGHLRGATASLIKSILSALDRTTPNSIVSDFGVVHWLEAQDFLLSKSYALPAFGFSVEELAEAGVFKLKTESHEK